MDVLTRPCGNDCFWEGLTLSFLNEKAAGSVRECWYSHGGILVGYHCLPMIKSGVDGKVCNSVGLGLAS